MIYITDVGTNIMVEGDELNSRYPYTGILSIPYNSTLVVLGEKTDMVVFKSVANFDTQFTGILGKIYIQGELVTRDNIIEKFNSIANVVPQGEGGDLSNYYTKQETNNLLNEKQDTLISGVNIKTINGESILGSGNIYIEGGSGGTSSCCSEILTNQATIIGMLETLVKDTNAINNIIDEINNETINCEYADETLIDNIINEQITC